MKIPKNKALGLKLFVSFHFAIVALLTLGVLMFVGREASHAVLTGGALSGANVLALGWTWKNILAKKLIALSVGVIVIKYAILGIIIYSIVTFEWMSVGWFAIGMGTLLISCVTYAISLEIFSENLNPNMDRIHF